MKKGDWFDNTFLKNSRPFFWVVGLGLLVYFWTIFFGFTYFDDSTLILDNLFYLKNLGNFFNTFTIEVFHVLHASAAYYRPILTISFMLDAQLSGESPFFYHVTNVVIHLITSCLVFVFLERLNVKKDLSFFFAVVFAVHPVLAQAVAWIPGRNDSLLALFFLASMICIMIAPASGKIKFYIWHLVFFALALFTKESALLIPLFVLLWHFLINRLAVKTGFKIKNSKLRINLPVVFLGWLVVVLLWYFLRRYALVNPIHYDLLTVAKAVYLELPAVFLYSGKVLFPVNLSVLPILQDSSLIYGFIASLLVIFSLLFSKNKNWKVVIFGTLLFFGFLLPSFVRPSYTYVPDFLEHRLYLPIIGLFLVFSEVDFMKRLDFSRKVVLGGSITFLTIIIFINFMHTYNFRSRLVYWQRAVSDAPHHPLAHKNLGAMLFLDGKPDEALPEYQKALELNPSETMVHNNIGLIYLNRKDYKDAEDEFKKELEFNPNYDNAFFNYGLLDYQEGKLDEAENMWLKTLQVNPDYTDAMKNLLVLYSQKNDQVKAAYYYNELLRRGISF
jgi:tetratricopeptide (TPR) repeat protein